MSFDETFIRENIACEFNEDSCDSCDSVQKEICIHKASVKSSSDFAKVVGYGGYDSEEEFWENLD